MSMVLSKSYSQIFCERLKELRKQSNLTQLDFAAIFNVSKGTVSTWETGTRMPPIDTLLAICKYFNCGLDYLFGLDAVEKYPTTFSGYDDSVDLATAVDVLLRRAPGINWKLTLIQTDEYTPSKY